MILSLSSLALRSSRRWRRSTATCRTGWAGRGRKADEAAQLGIANEALEARSRELEAKLVELEAALRQAAAGDEAGRKAAEALMASGPAGGGADRRRAREGLDGAKASAAEQEAAAQRKAAEAFNHSKELETLVAKLRDGQAASGSEFEARLADSEARRAELEEQLARERANHAATADDRDKTRGAREAARPSETPQR